MDNTNIPEPPQHHHSPETGSSQNWRMRLQDTNVRSDFINRLTSTLEKKLLSPESVVAAYAEQQSYSQAANENDYLSQMGALFHSLELFPEDLEFSTEDAGMMPPQQGLEQSQNIPMVPTDLLSTSTQGELLVEDFTNSPLQGFTHSLRTTQQQQEVNQEQRAYAGSSSAPVDVTADSPDNIIQMQTFWKRTYGENLTEMMRQLREVSMEVNFVKNPAYEQRKVLLEKKVGDLMTILNFNVDKLSVEQKNKLFHFEKLVVNVIEEGNSIIRDGQELLP